MNRLDELRSRLNQNFVDFNERLLKLDKKTIIGMAARISTMDSAHAYSMEAHHFDDAQMEYLLQFQNPLEIMADTWGDYSDSLADGLVGDELVIDMRPGKERYALTSEPAEHGIYLQKFETIDLIETLRSIAGQNIVHCPNDFLADIDCLTNYAAGNDSEMKKLFWHTSSYGTHLEPQRDTFISGTGSYNTWTRYVRPDMHGFAIEITGMEGDHILGNVYVLDHQKHIEHVRHVALPANTVTLRYDDGRKTTVSIGEYDDDRHRLMSESGCVTSLRFHPDSEGTLADVLERELRMQELTPAGNPVVHIETFADRRVETETARILAVLDASKEPNSPNKTHDAVGLSPEFVQLATVKEYNRVFDALPYKTKMLTTLKGEKGLFVTVKKEEIQKPSLLAKLKKFSQETSQQPKAMQQSKKHDKGAR